MIMNLNVTLTISLLRNCPVEQNIFARAEIDSECDKLVELINDLLDLEKFNAGQMNLNLTKIKMEALMLMGRGGKFVPHEHKTGPDGRWHFQNPRVKPGQDIAGQLKD